MESRPVASLLSVGWVLASDLRDPILVGCYQRARDRLLQLLETQFPEITWEMPWVQRRVYLPQGALPPLDLLELGGEEKLHRRWDYCLVIVPNELVPRHRVATVGVPSSALETAVLSSARLGDGEEMVERIVALALHLLGHLWGLHHAETGPMRPPEDPEDLYPEPFPDEQVEAVRERHREAANARLEELRGRWRPLPFYWRTFWAEPRGILHDILDYRPWTLPVYLGRLTAAAAVSTVFLLLTSDAWAVGTHLSPAGLAAGSVTAILAATLFVFWGQNVGQQGRLPGWSEQLARTRIVLFGTLLLGLVSLWAFLLGVSWVGALLLPAEVVAEWSGADPAALPLGRYSAFMATMGVVAAALGGNLEEEAEIKAELLFDEET